MEETDIYLALKGKSFKSFLLGIVNYFPSIWMFWCSSVISIMWTKNKSIKHLQHTSYKLRKALHTRMFVEYLMLLDNSLFTQLLDF